jgi:hypothetical protein
MRSLGPISMLAALLGACGGRVATTTTNHHDEVATSDEWIDVPEAGKARTTITIDGTTYGLTLWRVREREGTTTLHFVVVGPDRPHEGTYASAHRGATFSVRAGDQRILVEESWPCSGDTDEDCGNLETSAFGWNPEVGAWELAR